MLRLLVGSEEWKNIRVETFDAVAEFLKDKVSGDCISFLEDCLKPID